MNKVQQPLDMDLIEVNIMDKIFTWNSLKYEKIINILDLVDKMQEGKLDNVKECIEKLFTWNSLKYEKIINILDLVDKMQEGKINNVKEYIEKLLYIDDKLKGNIEYNKDAIGYIQLYASKKSYIDNIENFHGVDKISLFYEGIDEYAVIEQATIPNTENESISSIISSYISLWNITTSKVYEILNKKDPVKIYIVIKGKVNGYLINAIKQYLAYFLKSKYKVKLNVDGKNIYTDSILFVYYKDDNETQIIVRNYFTPSRSKLMEFTKDFIDLLLSKKENELADRININRYLESVCNEKGYYKKRTPFDKNAVYLDFCGDDYTGYINEYLWMSHICTMLRNYGRVSTNNTILNTNTDYSYKSLKVSTNNSDSFLLFIDHIITITPPWYTVNEYVSRKVIRNKFEEFCVANGIKNIPNIIVFGKKVNKYLKVVNSTEHRNRNTEERSIIVNDIETLSEKISKRK